MNDSLPRRARAAAGLAASTVLLAACGSGERNNPLGYEGGTAPGQDRLSTVQTVGLYVLAPLAVLLVVAALVWLPGMVRGSRYRPTKGWSAAPLWFGGPPDPAAAVETALAGDLQRGGASGGW